MLQVRVWVGLTGLDGAVDRSGVLIASRHPERMDVSDFGLSPGEGKAVLSELQAELTQFQVHQTSALDRPCLGFGGLRRIHDYRSTPVTDFAAHRGPNERFRCAVLRFKGVALMFDAISDAKTLLGHKGYDADWFRAALKARGVEPCIPPKSNPKAEIPFDKTLHKSPHKIEIMFGKLKDWRRIHTRCERSAHAFMSAVAIAATVIFWINQ